MDDNYRESEKIPRIHGRVLKVLSRLVVWRSGVAILGDWLLVAVAISLCERISYWFYPLSFVIIGTRFHGLEAMMHEAAHYRLHPNKAVNDFIGELSVWPLGLSLYIYRNIRHFPHHRNIGSPGDSHIALSYKKHAEWFDLPGSGRALLRHCLKAAVTFPRETWIGQLVAEGRLLPRLSPLRGWLWIGFQAVVAAALVFGTVRYGWHFTLAYALYFILPLMWVAVFSRYLRLVTEHFGVAGSGLHPVQGADTRTVLVAWPVRVVLWPHNINYHVEHHWYPSVPFYHLPRLHAILQKSPEAAPKMHVTRGLSNLLTELTASE